MSNQNDILNLDYVIKSLSSSDHIKNIIINNTFKYLNLFDQKGNSILQIAILNDMFDVVLDMLKTLKNVLCSNESSENMLIFRSYINHQNDESFSIVHLSVIKENINILKYVIEQCYGDTNIISKNGLDALVISACINNVAIMCYLIESSKKGTLNIDFTDITNNKYNGKNILHYIVIHGAVEAFVYIMSIIKNIGEIENYINITSNEGYTPLEYGIINKNLRMVKKLLQFGAKYDIKKFNKKLKIYTNILQYIEGNAYEECVTKPKVHANINNNDNHNNYNLEEYNKSIFYNSPKSSLFKFLNFYQKAKMKFLLNIKFSFFLIINIYAFFIVSHLTTSSTSHLYNTIYTIFFFFYILFLLRKQSYPDNKYIYSSLSEVVSLKIGDITRDPKYMNYYCPFCLIDKRNPCRTHCLECDKCINDFDHHCHWVGKCVNYYNFKLFYCFFFSFYCANVMNFWFLSRRIIYMIYYKKYIRKNEGYFIILSYIFLMLLLIFFAAPSTKLLLTFTKKLAKILKKK